MEITFRPYTDQVLAYLHLWCLETYGTIICEKSDG